MDNQNRARFNEMLGVMFGYYGEDLTAPVAAMYWHGLQHLTAEAVERAITKHLQDPKVGQFRPKVADLIRQAVDGAGGDSGLRAWTALTRAMNRIGAYQSVEFEDGVMAAVVSDMGGWPSMCRTTDEAWPFVRNEFVKRYEGYLARGEVVERRRLAGVCESTNASTGYLNPTYADGVAPAVLARRDGKFEELPAQRVAALGMPQTGANVAEKVAAPLAGAIQNVMARLKHGGDTGK